MRLFLSYASERWEIAERLSIALQSEGHVVFYDRSALPHGQAFDKRIREAIDRCHLFIFLISPESVQRSAYARSELEMMAKCAPVPGDRVLPVFVAPVDIGAVPNYLRNLTILDPVGDVTADVLATVSMVVASRRATLFRRLGLLATALTAMAAVLILLVRSGLLTAPRGETPSSSSRTEEPVETPTTELKADSPPASRPATDTPAAPKRPPSAAGASSPTAVTFSNHKVVGHEWCEATFNARLAFLPDGTVEGNYYQFPFTGRWQPVTAERLWFNFEFADPLARSSVQWKQGMDAVVNDEKTLELRWPDGKTRDFAVRREQCPRPRVP